MLIKFKKPDPRAGMTARMDSSRGQQLVDAGCAEVVHEGATPVAGELKGAMTPVAIDVSEKQILPPDDSAKNPEPEPVSALKPARRKK